MPEARLMARVHGYVQGVGYRVFAVREAQRLGLTGWTRNEAEGSVTVVAEGPRGALNELLGRLQRGPSEAEVSRVDVEWAPATGEFSAFRIAA
jgi:acylphosphatase